MAEEGLWNKTQLRRKMEQLWGKFAWRSVFVKNLAPKSDPHGLKLQQARSIHHGLYTGLGFCPGKGVLHGFYLHLMGGTTVLTL